MRYCALTVGLCLIATVGVAQEPQRLAGTFHVIWGDSPPELAWEGHEAYFLIDDEGDATELDLSPELMRAAGGVLNWNGRRVEVTLAAEPRIKAVGERTGLPVAALRALPARESAREDTAKTEGDLAPAGGITGSQPWVSILCKFSDRPTEPKNLAFFQGMYANVPGGLDHYWRELSYGAINIVGSTAVDWVTLPHPQTHYIPTPGSNSDANLFELFNDCTAAADPYVDFSNNGTPFVGINMMFNDNLDCCAWGGGMYANLDGISKSWRVTWEPPWGYASEGVIGHEMGHGFGLPHSNNWDNDSSPYDSPWDVMSSATGYSVYNSTYGSLGKHTIAYHKDMLGWIPAAQRFELAGPKIATITIDHLALAQTTHYRMARIPIGDGNMFYTVEVRKPEGEYDGNLPGTAVIIHQIDPNRTEHAWAVDHETPPANYADNEGVMWRVGETFEDAANEIMVSVNSATVDGFEVTLALNPSAILFYDEFESGAVSPDWSSIVD